MLGIDAWLRSEGGYRTQQIQQANVYEARLQSQWCFQHIQPHSPFAINNEKDMEHNTMSALRTPQVGSYGYKTSRGSHQKPAMSPRTYIKRGLDPLGSERLVLGTFAYLPLPPTIQPVILPHRRHDEVWPQQGRTTHQTWRRRLLRSHRFDSDRSTAWESSKGSLGA